jgi:hypothetical protein
MSRQTPATAHILDMARSNIQAPKLKEMMKARPIPNPPTKGTFPDLSSLNFKESFSSKNVKIMLKVKAVVRIITYLNTLAASP